MVLPGVFATGYSINEGWRFTLKPVEAAGSQMDSDDKNWQIISFPHTWNEKDARNEHPGYYRGKGWYRKALFMGEEFKDKCVEVYFEGANQTTELYVNGIHAGTHKGGYTRFVFDITPYIRINEDNLLAISVNNSHDVSIPPLSADFTFFGGIYRDVYLLLKEQIHLSNADDASEGVYITTPVVTREKGEVEIRTLLNNRMEERKQVVVDYTLIAPDGTVVAKQKQKVYLEGNSNHTEVIEKFTVKNPCLWSPDHPDLYKLQTQVYDQKKSRILDTHVTTMGFRWFHFDARQGFFLNGEPLKLIGTNRHQCYEGIGNALRDEFHIQDMLLLKRMGGNFIRIAHYPQDPLILQMCDKLGILASVEVPIINAITESEEFLANSMQMASEMVKQNFNHPSLIMWAYMNEIMLRPPHLHDADKHKAYCKEVNRQASTIDKLIRSLDPYRYTMQAFHGNMESYDEESTDLIRIPQIVGWNLYSGWYGGVFYGFDEFLDSYHTRYPDIPVLITEYGADVDVRLHSFDSERFDYTEEYGDRYHEHYLKTIMKRDYVAGATIWNLNDFHSELRGNALPHINCKGITTTTREPKNTYTLYQTHLNSKPMITIGNKSWQRRGGLMDEKGVCVQPVKIYSNQPQAKVYHNGAFLETVFFKDCVATVNVPFKAGKNTLEAVVTEHLLSDSYTSFFELIPDRLADSDFFQINIMLGSKRYFEDREADLIWIPEKEYLPGSWGYIGGKAFRPKTRHGSLPASDLEILGTNQDPIFQTQRIGLESFKLDVMDGKYAVYLYWADLSVTDKEALPYNLGNDVIDQRDGASVFNVSINSTPILMNYNIQREAGNRRAVIKKFLVDVIGSRGIDIKFESLTGDAFLNAIRVVKLD